METENVTLHLTEKQRDWLIAAIRDDIDYTDDWNDELTQAESILDALLATKGQRRYTVRARSEASVVVAAVDETTAREAAKERLADMRTGGWVVEQVRPLTKD